MKIVRITSFSMIKNLNELLNNIFHSFESFVVWILKFLF